MYNYVIVTSKDKYYFNDFISASLKIEAFKSLGLKFTLYRLTPIYYFD